MNKYLFLSAVLFCASFVLANVASATIAPPPPPPQFPTSTDQCKKGGWENYNGMFKNQGDCVSFVVTDGRNAPDGPGAN